MGKNSWAVFLCGFGVVKIEAPSLLVNFRTTGATDRRRRRVWKGKETKEFFVT